MYQAGRDVDSFISFSLPQPLQKRQKGDGVRKMNSCGEFAPFVIYLRAVKGKLH